MSPLSARAQRERGGDHAGTGGRDVALVDKATFPRDKCCGDGLTTGALRLLEELGVSPLVVPSWQSVDAAWVRSPSGTSVDLPAPAAAAASTPAVARRTELDALAGRSRARRGRRGARGLDAHRRAHDRRRDRARRRGLGHDHARGWRSAPTACGHRCARRSAPPKPGYLGEWHAFRQYFTDVGPAAASTAVGVVRARPAARLRVVVPAAGRRANVGFGIPRGGAIATPGDEAAVARAARAPAHPRRARRVRRSPRRPTRRGRSPPGSARCRSAAPRALFVGDAAGATDPMTGEGIGQALLTGDARGRGDPRPRTRRTREQVAAGYRRRGAAPASSPTTACRSRSARSSSGRRARGRRSASRAMTGWTRQNFARWLFEDEPRAIVLTPRRWHRAFPRPRRRLRRRADGRPAPFTATTQAGNVALRTLPCAIEPRRSRGVRSQVEARHLSRPPGEVTGLAA